MTNNAFIIPFISQIKASKTMEQGFVYNPAKWMLLHEKHRNWLRVYENRLIDRNDILQSFEDYFDGKCEVIKPFLLTMLWGFAETNYGNYRTNLYISDPENIQSIKEAVDLARLGDFEKGFKKLKKIKFLGVSYLTKVLYFVSKAANHIDYCLIFDIRVATSLIQLTTPKEIYQLVDIYPSSKFKDYQVYNTLIHQIAKDFELNADDVEYFLFAQEFKK